MQGAQKLKEGLDAARSQLEMAQRQGDFAKAGELAYSVIPGLEKKIKDAEANGDARSDILDATHPDGLRSGVLEPFAEKVI